ncbi:MAG: hypothetical protein ACRDJP_13630 [Actinomycetota bacterium]
MSAAEVIELRDRARRKVRGQEIVAVVLSDGSIRDLREGGEDEPAEPYATGQLHGEGWTMWWDRRSW